MISLQNPTLSPIYRWQQTCTSSGLNLTSTKSASNWGFAILNNKLYHARTEQYPTTSVTGAWVSVYNGDDNSPAWSDVTGGSGLNIATNTGVVSMSICVFNGKLYGAISYGNPTQIRVRVYNGNDSSPSWSAADTGTLSVTTNQPSGLPKLYVFNNKLYLTWMDIWRSKGTNFQQIRVRVYNGNDSSPSWTLVDGGAAFGLNKDSSRDGTRPEMQAFNDKLYLSWIEESATGNQVRAAVYNGNDSSPSWTFIDGNAATGLNVDTSTSVSSIARLVSFVYNSKLYAVWSEGGKFRMKVYNGNDSSPSWTLADGGLGLGEGISVNMGGDVSIATHPNWYPHVTFRENSTPTSARVGVVNGTDGSWRARPVDSNSSFINSAVDTNALDCVFFNGTIHVVYGESAGNTILKTMRGVIA